MKNNKNKLKIISATICLLAFNNAAHAQFLVEDIGNTWQNAITAGESIITSAQSTITATQSTFSALYGYLNMNANATNGQKMEDISQSINLMNQQSVLNNVDQDRRKRVADGQMAVINNIMNNFPTLQSCVEKSNMVGTADSVPRGGAAKAATKATGGGTQSSKARSMAVTSTATAQAELLKKQKDLGTCITELAGSGGCSGDDKYAGGDIQPRGIKGDIKDISRDEQTKAEYNSFTMDKDAIEVAKSYVANATYYDKPKVTTKAQLEKNPVYGALYKTIQTKLDAAHGVLTDIYKIRRQADADINTSVGVGKTWANSVSNYTKITGLNKHPGNKPSMFELTNFEVKNDYLGGDTKVDLTKTEEVNKRLALSNYIAWQSYQQQENTNLLLSHILVQLTTPANKAQLDSEFGKTVNMK